MYKQDLALNNLQGLIYHKTQPNNQPDLFRTLTGTTTPDQSGPEGNCNKKILNTP